LAFDRESLAQCHSRYALTAGKKSVKEQYSFHHVKYLPTRFLYSKYRQLLVGVLAGQILFVAFLLYEGLVVVNNLVYHKPIFLSNRLKIIWYDCEYRQRAPKGQ
jgi:hypothetical protein